MGLLSFVKKLVGSGVETKIAEVDSRKDKESELPPVTAADISNFENWLDEKALQHVALVPTDQAPTLLGSRLGGHAGFPKGGKWPLDKQGKPMLLLAQVNFADLGRLPNFPKKGLLQFFIQSDDLFGMNFDEALDSDTKVVWSPDPSVLTDSLPQQIDYKKDYSPFMKKEVLENGIALSALPPEPQRPEWGVYFVGKKIDEFFGNYIFI